MKNQIIKICGVFAFLLLLSTFVVGTKARAEDYVVCPGIGVKCMTVTTEVPLLGEISIPRFKGKNRGSIELKEEK